MYLYERWSFALRFAMGATWYKAIGQLHSLMGSRRYYREQDYRGTCVGCRIRAKRKIFYYYFEVSRSCKSAVIARNPLTPVALLIKPTWPIFARLEKTKVFTSPPLSKKPLFCSSWSFREPSTFPSKWRNIRSSCSLSNFIQPTQHLLGLFNQLFPPSFHRSILRLDLI